MVSENFILKMYGITVLAVIAVVAVYRGIDHAVIASVSGVIGGIVGFTARRLAEAGVGKKIFSIKNTRLKWWYNEGENA